MTTVSRIALAIIGLCAVFAVISERFLQIDPAWPASVGILVGLLALLVVPSKMRLLLIILNAGVGGYLFFRADSFWGIVVCGLVIIWCLVGLLPLMDGAWRFKIGLVVCSFLAGSLVLWPTVSRMSDGKLVCPQYIQDRIDFGIAPGLDLRGGLRLAYTVEVEEAIRDKRDHLADDMRQDLATSFGFHSGDGRVSREELQKLESKVHVATPESAILRLKFKDAGDVSKIDDRFTKKFTTELALQRGPGADEVTFKIRAEVESQIRERAVAQAKETIVRRVDGLGLREASVTTRDEDIILEVPGDNEKQFDDIRDTIRRTARLEFKMVDDEADFFGKIKDEELPEGEGIAIYNENAPAGPGKNVQSHFARITKRENETMTQSRERFKKWAATLPVPDDHQVGFLAIEDYDPDTSKTTEVGWRTFYMFSRAELTGDSITEANVAQEQNQGMGKYYVGLTFSPAGADRFEEITGSNIKRRFAIILDDVVDSAPVIQAKIGGGRASITMGAGDPEQQLAQARKLELVLRSGALPAPVTPSNESRIGPSLGRDAIGEGLKGAAAGVGLVLVALAFYYRKSGVVADLAVLFNLLLQLAILSTFGATMTLPGIAGLALTVGIGVDANVLINERIREELRAGRTVRAAVEAGYDKAFSSILDGHVTVFISGLILAQYGTGPVKGFAVTLIVGIVCSLFTGVFCTRLVFDWWARGAKVKRLSVGAEF
ncbi:protein translocase subunit SecD [Pendulispora rubella]|uniref:Protein translocase subunit SecD n=1 Tax=Pendulispora rubella TaxID=2741070 RepID=A0ABZ2KX13_9BACT